jgi:hypothetical protein
MLGASRCDEFANPAYSIAKLTREMRTRRPDAFDCVAFAGHHTGYGPSNYPDFNRAFK